MNLHEQMKRARAGIQSDKVEQEQYLGKIEAESRQRDADKNSMMQHLRKANIADYLDWLSAYSKVNQEVFTHRYDYSFYQQDFYVALTDFTIKPLYGAPSINIIVPDHITVHGDVGHNKLFLHGENPESVGHYVPYFIDLDGNEGNRNFKRASVDRGKDCLVDAPTVITAALLMGSSNSEF